MVLSVQVAPLGQPTPLVRFQYAQPSPGLRSANLQPNPMGLDPYCLLLQLVLQALPPRCLLPWHDQRVLVALAFQVAPYLLVGHQVQAIPLFHVVLEVLGILDVLDLLDLQRSLDLLKVPFGVVA